MKQQRKAELKPIPAAAPQRILGRALGREISAEESARVAGGWDQSPDPSGTMPFQAGGEWSYGDWNPV